MQPVIKQLTNEIILFHDIVLKKQHQKHSYNIQLNPFKSVKGCFSTAIETREEGEWRDTESHLTPPAQTPWHRDTMDFHSILTSGHNPTRADISGR